MISQGAVSLRAARQDCGLPATGGLKTVEFNERAGYSNPSLASLRGTIACRSSKQETGQYRQNYNRGSSCRPNYSEANVFGLDNDHFCVLSSGTSATGYGFHDHDVVSGYSFSGTAPAGKANFHYDWTDTKGQSVQLEIIGWTSGPFAGTPKYYVSVTRNSLSETIALNLDGAYPYITVIITAFSFGGNNEAGVKVNSVRVWR